MNTASRSDRDELAALDARINAFLPPIYRGCYTEVAPTSMGSAQVRYGSDGKVAWDDIWTTFCDLALAGGPPHRGTFLDPPSPEAVAADPTRYHEVTAEIHRAVGLTTGLPSAAGLAPGWIGVACPDEAMAAWVQLAVVAENVSCRRRGCVLHLPAGPAFRVEKEIKNVTAALAKACHYWEGHLSAGQRAAGGAAEVWEPATVAEAADQPEDYSAAASAVADGLRAATGRPIFGRYGWAGVDTGSEDAAVWQLRAVVADGVLARREGGVLYLPVGVRPDPGQADRVVQAFDRAWRLWGVQRATTSE